ncbi:acyl-CoA synthetase [Bacillus kwashiorkori]|uniref:acyl-CoA synthetase n=1 Tax=Bacillus kwashiorkori TaxID=1522318 RepID=UPI000A7C5464|nr:long-chain fatty acid--CoA ligase [Bacillus kwashiorkori]
MDWIGKRASIYPEKIALVDIEYNRSLTYKQLEESVALWVTYLKSIPIKKGERVAVLVENQIDIFEIMFACGSIGAIFVPLNYRLSEYELTYILQDCSPIVLLYNEKFQQMAKRLPVKNKVQLTDANWSCDNETVKRCKTNLTDDNPMMKNEPWLIIYTGGTTGRPKGVVLTYQAIFWNAINTIISWGLSNEEITLTYMPLFHTGGINALSFPILFNGGTVVVGNKFDPGAALRYLVEYKCSIALFVPTMYHMMQQTKEFESLDFSNMKVFLSGGAPCPLSIYDHFARKKLPFKEGYGLTEAGPNNFVITPDAALIKRGSVGKPMMLNDVKIMKFDGSEAGINEVGELLIRGGHVFKEYWNNPEATKETLQDGWLHTGDLARKDEEGFYYIVGRKKDMIISGGENVYPLEIEHWLAEHPTINEAVVIGLPDEKWGEVITAFITLKKGATVSEQELKQHCSYKLASYKIPKKFYVLDELPKTHVGKISKQALQSEYEQFI